jgi:hypothetical protein
MPYLAVICLGWQRVGEAGMVRQRVGEAGMVRQRVGEAGMVRQRGGGAMRWRGNAVVGLIRAWATV